MTAHSQRAADWTRSDGLFVALSLTHGCLLVVCPSIAVIGLGLWWNANTVSHNFIHRPFFRARALNAGYSCFLSLLLGFPQSLWRARHLAHHSAHEERRKTRKLEIAALDLVAVAVLWVVLVVFATPFTLTVYLPGFLLGLSLCYLQGHYEHARGTISHYGKFYNLLLFNDGFHAEHHARPGAHWRELPKLRRTAVNESRWPAALRWLEYANLCALERLVLRSSALQSFVLGRHERALRRLPIDVQSVRHVGIVGGGLFPRTAIILRRLLPYATLTIVEMNSANIAASRRFVDSDVEYLVERFDPSTRCDFDLLVVPLAFVGDRATIYRRPPASTVLVHDWIWRRRGASVIVSWLLLKRVNLVKR